jgi:hypothetical protein
MKLIKNDLEKKLQEMVQKSGKAAAARAYPLYQKLQTERFKTENASQGAKWKPLSPLYKEYKEKKMARYPGGGRKTLIATSTLAGAVIGKGAPFYGTDKHVALFKNYSMQISVKTGGKNAAGKPFDYPDYVAKDRPFMTFDEKSMELMKDTIMKFIVGGK